MGKEFDIEGLLFAIEAIEEVHVESLPEDMQKFGFCMVCLGFNVPDQDSYPKCSFCCGSIYDGWLPAWGICKRFKVDRERVAALAKRVRPDGSRQTVSRAYG